MNNRVVKNAAWIIGVKIIQAILGLLITMLSARYLGPSQYGIINYAASIVAFFVPIMQLGFHATLVQEIISEPQKEGETMGTSLVMSFVSSFACVIGVTTFCLFVNRGELETITICVLYSILLIFQSIEMIQYWFQAKLLSKYTSIAMLISYAVISAYKIMLLVFESHIYLFAISQALEFLMVAGALLVVYKKVGTQKLSFSLNRAKEIFGRSKHYILSGLMIAFFSQTDRIMIKLMMDDASVGFYSAAVSCAGLTGFVFVAIIDSGRPTILEGAKISDSVFCERLKTLYSIVIYLALAQSVFITLFAKLVVLILYGADYSPTISALQIIVWYTTFSYIGAVRDIWILYKGKQNLLWIINLSGAALNVVLNSILIPILEINGAAVASLITQIFTNVVVGFILKPIRYNNKLMFQSLTPKYIVNGVKGLLYKKK